MNPVAAFSDAIQTAFADLATRAPAESPFGLARERLGRDRYLTVATEALRRHIKRTLTDGAVQTLRDVRDGGAWGERLVVATILEGVVADVIRAAA